MNYLRPIIAAAYGIALAEIGFPCSTWQFWLLFILLLAYGIAASAESTESK